MANPEEVARPHKADDRSTPTGQHESSPFDALSLFAERGKHNTSSRTVPAEWRGACSSMPEKPPPEPDFAKPVVPPVQRRFQTFDLLKNDRPFDPSKPTVAVFDDFRHSVFAPNGPDKPGLAHGEVTAAAAESAGFNVLRLASKSEDIPLFVTLREIGAAMKSGKLPLKAGDAVNFSMGGELTWNEASCALKMSVQPDTYAAQREPIMKRMADIASGKVRGVHPIDRERVGIAVENQQAVADLQARGVDVVHAAGNSGPLKFDWDFINANKQLSASDGAGRIYPFSANHSLTQPYKGSFQLEYHRSNVFDPTPIGKQNGYYQLDGTNVRFPAARFGGYRTESMQIIRGADGEPMEKPPEAKLTADMFDPKPSPFASFERGRLKDMKNGLNMYDSFGSRDRAWPVAKIVEGVGVPRESTSPAATAAPGTSAEVVIGTSFSNVTYWFDRMRQIQETKYPSP